MSEGSCGAVGPDGSEGNESAETEDVWPADAKDDSTMRLEQLDSLRIMYEVQGLFLRECEGVELKLSKRSQEPLC